MSTLRDRDARSLWRNAVECLESRALLAAGAYTAPDLSGLIAAALDRGVNTGPAAIRVMTDSLASQLTAGPLAGLDDGSLTPEQFQAEVTTYVDDYDAGVTDQLGGRFPHITEILHRQGAMIESDIAALAAERAAGQIDDATFAQEAAAAIDTLTQGPLRPLHSPYSAYVTATRAFESKLDGVVAALQSGATDPVTVAQAQTLVRAESDAYGASMRAALTLRPGVEAAVATALQNLGTATDALTATNAAADLQAAVDAFDRAILDTTGLFGPLGPVAWHLQHGRTRHA